MSAISTWTIGYDRQFDMLRSIQSMMDAKPNSYPPYNILKVSEDRFQVHLAVAGFSKKEIEISVKNGTLTITGKKDFVEGEVGEYLHKGIATRSFSQTFALGEYIQVTGASFEDGILSISLERILPEALRERVIEIS